MYVGLLVKIVEMLTQGYSIHSSINRNFEPGKYRKYLKFLNIVIPGSSGWLNSRIQSKASKKIEEQEQRIEELKQKMGTPEESKDLMEEIEALKKELQYLKKSDVTERIGKTEDEIR